MNCFIVLTRLATSLLRYDRYPGHVPVTSLSFSPDGHFLVSGCPVNSIMLVSKCMFSAVVNLDQENVCSLYCSLKRWLTWSLLVLHILIVLLDSLKCVFYLTVFPGLVNIICPIE